MRRVLCTLGLIAFLLGAARLTLGPPDLVQALTFFAGGIPTEMAGESVVVLLAWSVIVVAVLGLLAGMTQFVERSQLLRTPSVRSAVLLTASLVLLVVGAVHRSTPPSLMCCGSGPAEISEAIHLAQ